MGSAQDAKIKQDVGSAKRHGHDMIDFKKVAAFTAVSRPRIGELTPAVGFAKDCVSH